MKIYVFFCLYYIKYLYLKKKKKKENQCCPLKQVRDR